MEIKTGVKADQVNILYFYVKHIVITALASVYYDCTVEIGNSEQWAILNTSGELWNGS